MTTNAAAPTSDVTTPMESSTGLSSVRAIKSASSKKIAPENIDAGSSRLWFGPAIIRAICGTTSPTKPMLPPMETHTPIITDTVIKITSLTRLTFTPMWRALLPNGERVQFARIAEDHAAANQQRQRQNAGMRVPVPESEPIVQNVMERT